MSTDRRSFLKTAAATTAVALGSQAVVGAAEGDKSPNKAELDRILDAPTLSMDWLNQPVKVASVELLKNGRVYLLRIRSTDGVEAITVPNPERMAITYPIFLKNIVPVFVGQDAREVERLLWDMYRHNSNYKLRGLAFWVGVAAMEMGLLELLGRSAARPVADFFGGAVR